ncbi:hypothetical protein [Tunturiibacter gelidoferens]|uniref:Uncharacterized protein n=1 Tax=Tunturiibacter gelidiferens TaxID=3069689 RepID=A0A9X0QC72_9BACT|nr:hypothetical protein [Edaphobacter lichenicola]MBB5327568.1 hypothetical protein [Edaphobacter lichenicola]
MIGEIRDDARLTADEVANRVAGSERRIYPAETAPEVIDDRRDDLVRDERVVDEDWRTTEKSDDVFVREPRVVGRTDDRYDERAAVGQTTAGVDSTVGSDQPGQLFPTTELNDLRAKWDKAQIGFVDEPRTAVKQADELVATLVTRISEQFSATRTELEHQWDRGDNVSTEDLRQALRRYRSFFDRLLAF